MPSRNIARQDAPESYYHVYARGASKQRIFPESVDYQYFTKLLERYLSGNQAISKTGLVYPSFHDSIELLAYCLMGNHFHLMIYQQDQGALKAFMQSLMTSYSRYFNLKYKRSGSLFESRYKAAIITQDAYLLHISRYIHLNPRSWKYYKHSSIGYYRNCKEPEWLKTKRVLALHNNDRAEYLNFLSDYEEYKKMLKTLKYGLADS